MGKLEYDAFRSSITVVIVFSYPVDTEAKEKYFEEQLLLSCFTPCMYTNIVCNNFSLYYIAIIIRLTLPLRAHVIM